MPGSPETFRLKGIVMLASEGLAHRVHTIGGQPGTVFEEGGGSRLSPGPESIRDAATGAGPVEVERFTTQQTAKLPLFNSLYPTGARRPATQ